MNRQVVAGAAARQRQTTSTPIVIADGTLEALKWLALILMTLDHVNKYLLDPTQPVLFALAVFVVGRGVVEYWWFALGLAVTCWRYCKQPGRLRLCVVVGCVAW